MDQIKVKLDGSLGYRENVDIWGKNKGTQLIKY